MGNCLVTKFKSSVSNKSLPKFGFCRFSYETTSSGATIKIGGAPGTGGTVIYYDMEYNETGRRHYTPPVEYTILYKSDAASGIIDAEGSYDVVNEIVVFKNWGSDILNGLYEGRYPNLTKVVWQYAWMNISNMGKNKNLTIATFQGDTISGNVEDFLKGMFDNGRVSGTLTLKIQNATLIKLHNATASLGEYTVTFNSTGCVVAFGGSTVATLANGSWTYA